MPELPEVETVRRGLEQVLPRLQVTSIEVRAETCWRGEEDAGLGGAVSGLDRRGKLLHIHLDNGWTWLVHLRMTGQLIYIPHDGTPAAGGGHPSDTLLSKGPTTHTRVVIGLSNGAQLLFNDQRKFGYVKATPTTDLDQDTFLQTLGPEPWDPGFDADYLREICQRRAKSTIKALLLDQKVVAGFGNIYVDEALFLTGIRPTRKAGRIAKKALARLIVNGREVLERGIEFGGVSVSDYVNAEGLRGTMQQQLYVYSRKGEPCKECESPIQKISLGGRGTHYCATCQR